MLQPQGTSVIFAAFVGRHVWHSACHLLLADWHACLPCRRGRWCRQGVWHVGCRQQGGRCGHVPALLSHQPATLSPAPLLITATCGKVTLGCCMAGRSSPTSSMLWACTPPAKPHDAHQKGRSQRQHL